MVFFNCVDTLVGEVGSRIGKAWVYGSVRLCVEWFFGCVLVCVLNMLLLLVTGICVRRGSFRRLPALKASVVIVERFGSVTWLLGLVCLDGCVGEVGSVMSCSVVRFRLRWAGGRAELS